MGGVELSVLGAMMGGKVINKVQKLWLALPRRIIVVEIEKS